MNATSTAEGGGGRRIVAPLTVFVLLTVVWGSSYFFTELALISFGTIQVVTLRIALGFAVLGALIPALGLRLPSRSRSYFHAAFVGVACTALPLILVTEGQRHVGTSLATVLVSLTPIFVFIFATILGRAKFGIGTAAGVLLAFCGVTVLSLAAGTVASVDWRWVLAIAACAALFAVGNIYTASFLGHLHPAVLVFLQLGAATVVMMPLLLATEGLPVASPSPLALVGLVELGVLGSALGYVMLSYLIRTWGSTATSINTYLQPIVGLLLGVLVLRETMSLEAWASSALTLVGVLVFGASSLRGTRRAPPLI